VSRGFEQHCCEPANAIAHAGAKAGKDARFPPPPPKITNHPAFSGGLLFLMQLTGIESADAGRRAKGFALHATCLANWLLVHSLHRQPSQQ